MVTLEASPENRGFPGRGKVLRKLFMCHMVRAWPLVINLLNLMFDTHARWFNNQDRLRKCLGTSRFIIFWEQQIPYISKKHLNLQSDH